MNKQQLLERIRQTAYLEGDFTLRSGKKSKYYIDKYLFETCPDILQALGEHFAQFVTDDIAVIAGAELGGVALAAATALETGKKWIIVRSSKKNYGTKKLIEGKLSPGQTVLLLEDVVTTGGQIIEAANIIKNQGAKIKQIVAVIDRKQGAKENITAAGYSFESLFTKEDLKIQK